MLLQENICRGKVSIFKRFTQEKVRHTRLSLTHPSFFCLRRLSVWLRIGPAVGVSPVILAGGLSHLSIIVRVPAPSLATRLITLPLNADNVIIKTADEHELSSLWQQKASFTGGRIAKHHPGFHPPHSTL